MAPKKAPSRRAPAPEPGHQAPSQILKTADLEKTTVKNIQKQLEAELGVPMSDASSSSARR